MKRTGQVPALILVEPQNTADYQLRQQILYGRIAYSITPRDQWCQTPLTSQVKQGWYLRVYRWLAKYHW